MIDVKAVVGLLHLRLRFALQGSAPSPVQQTGGSSMCKKLRPRRRAMRALLSAPRNLVLFS
jgi:hypothetical protein